MIKKEDYKRGRWLGDAPFGDIFEGTDKSNKEKAIKIFDK